MCRFLLGLGTLLIGIAAQAAPGDVFLLQIPNINGGVNVAKYRGWIAVNSFSVGITTPVSVNSGGGGGAGRPMCEPLTIIKPLDTTSPELALAAATGKHITAITLAALSGNDHEFLRFVLKNATVTSILFGGDSVSSSRTETLTVTASQIQISSTPQLADGAAGSTVTTDIDCETGKIQ